MAKYKELKKVQIQEKRNLVISKSETSDKVVLGQQILVDEAGRQIGIFLKGAIFVDTDKLLDVHKALTDAIYQLGLTEMQNIDPEKE